MQSTRAQILLHVEFFSFLFFIFTDVYSSDCSPKCSDLEELLKLLEITHRKNPFGTETSDCALYITAHFMNDRKAMGQIMLTNLSSMPDLYQF